MPPGGDGATAALLPLGTTTPEIRVWLHQAPSIRLDIPHLELESLHPSSFIPHPASYIPHLASPHHAQPSILHPHSPASPHPTPQAPVVRRSRRGTRSSPSTGHCGSRTPVGWGRAHGPRPSRGSSSHQLQSSDLCAPPPSLRDLRPLGPARRGDRGAGVKGAPTVELSGGGGTKSPRSEARGLGRRAERAESSRLGPGPPGCALREGVLAAASGWPPIPLTQASRPWRGAQLEKRATLLAARPGERGRRFPGTPRPRGAGPATVGPGPAGGSGHVTAPGQGVMVPVNGLGFPPQNVARVVVWEWLNDHSRWRPYTATVCHHIENVLKEDARGSVVLGQVDAQLVPYIIDLQSMQSVPGKTQSLSGLRPRSLWSCSRLPTYPPVQTTVALSDWVPHTKEPGRKSCSLLSCRTKDPAIRGGCQDSLPHLRPSGYLFHSDSAMAPEQLGDPGEDDQGPQFPPLLLTARAPKSWGMEWELVLGRHQGIEVCKDPTHTAAAWALRGRAEWRKFPGVGYRPPFMYTNPGCVRSQGSHPSSPVLLAASVPHFLSHILLPPETPFDSGPGQQTGLRRAIPIQGYMAPHVTAKLTTALKDVLAAPWGQRHESTAVGQAQESQWLRAAENQATELSKRLLDTYRALRGEGGANGIKYLGQAAQSQFRSWEILQPALSITGSLSFLKSTMRPVRRNFYDPSSAPGKGIVWEWENDGGAWTAYDMDICITIQNAYEKQHPWLDLSSLGFCYLIYFNSMSQMNRQTRRPPPRLRRRLDLAYPLTVGSIPKSQSWPVGANSGQPCSCQQCLLVNSTRAASNAILASQRRKAPIAPAAPPAPPPPPPPLPPGGPPSALAVRPAPPFAGAALWAAPAVVPTEPAPPPGVPPRSPSAPNGAPTGQNNLSRPGPQRATSVSARASIPPGVPALPVKNLNGTGPVHPALAGMTGILLCAAGLPVCLTRAPKPILHPPPVSKSDVKPVPGVPGVCRKTKKKHLKKSKNPEDVVRRYMQKVKNPPDEDCTICMERLVTASGYEGVLRNKSVRPELVGRLGRCGHMYHLLCLVAMYSNGNKDGSLQCPTCKAIYGEKTGTQPPGKMEFHVIPHSLPGFADTQTIRIVYDIPTGIQGPEHPNPGKKFTARGFPRHCYLPNNEKGRKVLRLLITAWERRLIFTIGTSNTTGESDTVVWNEIHHKTEFGSNLTGHGYPDASYLDNVLAELTAQGVSEAMAKA
ncbi:LOW QUALITY PROTEIN: E3 ubiquitin-protein ligase DTX1 [Arvicola amphibius]|uniref:LOW QUALITY PROTEIN: E3 ubiquitin-protein ligase DTX1 n=1 Tax=Arvicola amphibius TaxID=1047088 RepID=UPI001C08168D|nr:LOW QUALITY PROTEIN: E3 ubiquitin-protein ligase DTX1 [Arvicola amphibius]